MVRAIYKSYVLSRGSQQNNSMDEREKTPYFNALD